MSTAQGSERGIWQRWLDFWFAAADPTTLGFMRIVTGCLALYVHLAYCFDLHSFFGPDGWYGLEYVNRERTELPYIYGPWDWRDAPRGPTVPEFPHRRKAVMQYIRDLVEKRPSRAQLDQSMKYIDRIQQFLVSDQSGRYDQQGLLYVMQLSEDPTIRRNQLAAVGNAALQDKDKQNRPKEPVPALVELLPPEERAKVPEEIEAFFQTLPKDTYDRSYVLNHLIEMSPDQRTAFVNFVRDLITMSPEERAARLDYLEYWNTDSKLVNRMGTGSFSIWYHITDPVEMGVAHGVILLIMLLFTMGVFTRVTAVLTWLAAISYIHRTSQVLFGMDTMMNILLFYCMIGNCGAALSVDRLIKRYLVVRESLRRSGTIDARTLAYLDQPPPSVSAGFALRLLQVHFCFIYMAAGVSKLKGAAWWNTNAYWDTLVNPEFTLIHFHWYEAMVREVAANRVLYSLMAGFGVYFTFFAELGLPFLVWTRLRAFIVTCGFMLHAGVAVFMGLWIFSLLMMTLLLCYLPGAAIRDRIFGGPSTAGKLKLFGQSRSPAQRRATALARALDFDNRLEFVESTSGPLRLQYEGKDLTGSELTRRLFKELGWLRMFGWALWIPGLSNLIRWGLEGQEAKVV